MTAVVMLAATIALLALLAGLRSHRELVGWLGSDPYARRRGVRTGLLIGGTALIAWAWLQAAQQPPRFSGAGIDVVLALDTSRSMDVIDTAPSRLRRALRTAEQLVQAAEGARLGLVVFAGDAYVALPLTLDRDVHELYLRALDSEVLSNKGTDLARALRTAASVFDPRSPRPRLLVLLSDGEHAGANLDDVLVELRGAGIRVTAVGFGRPGGDVVPGPRGGPIFDPRGIAVVSRRSDAILERIVAGTGGRYLRDLEDAPNGADLLPPASALASAAEPPGTRLLNGLLMAALLLLALELLVSSAPAPWPRLPRIARRRAPVAVLACLLLGLGPQTWLEEGDHRLREGEVQEALSLYRRNARAYGASVASQLRIGNALHRMEEHDRAAASFLEALRSVTLDERDERFVASFNLGVTLLASEHYEEARDHFWTALLERSESLEAKFNYEWASERTREQEPPPAEIPEPLSATGAGAGGKESGDGSAGGAGGQADAARALENAPPRGAPALDPEEAQRWLDTIDDAIQEPLRRQAASSLGSGGPRRRGGQSW